MERYIMFLDWKNQHCENDYTTHLIITDIYTIKIDMEESIVKDEKDIDKEYEELLKIVSKSIK